MAAAMSDEIWLRGRRDVCQSPPYVRCVVLALLCVISTFPASARCGSIFDDEWTPPAQGVGPDAADARPIVPSRPAHSVDAEPSDSGSSAPKTQPSSVADTKLQLSRRPPPPKSDQAQSRKLLKEAFAEKLKDHTPQGRQKLVKALIEEAGKDGQNASDQFVLLTGAIVGAEEAGDLRACFTAADAMATQYAVSGLAIKADAAIKLSSKSYGMNAASNVRAGLDLLDELSTAEDFSTASRLSPVLQRAAAGDAALRAAVQKHARAIDILRAARGRIEPALQKLKTSPDDPAANLAVGEYYCFRADRWERGLPRLARGSDATLKKLATAELGAPTETDAVVQLADGWWEAAPTQPEFARGKLLEHAASLYSSVLDKLTGLKRTTIEKRIADASKSGGGGIINLLAILNPARAAASGNWKFVGNRLTTDGGVWCAKLEFPYVPPAEYDYRIVFTLVRGKEAVDQVCVGGDAHPFCWCIGSFAHSVSGFEVVAGHNLRENPTARSSKDWLPVGERTESLVKVRKNGVEAYLNDKLISSWKTNFADMSIRPADALKDSDAIGLLVFAGAVEIETAEIVEISGPGRMSK